MAGARLLIENIGLLWTMAEGVQPGAMTAPLCGEQMMCVGEVRNAGIAIADDGTILCAGPAREAALHVTSETECWDAQGGFACPGFVDPHTHLVHAGSREHELAARLAGASYLDILADGGGIMATVRATRAATDDALFEQALVSARRMRACGVTTLEAKTGYGLCARTELRQLQVAQRVARSLGLRMVHTALPAHAIPPARLAHRDAYIADIIAMLPELRAAGATYADVFVEQGVFSVEEGRAILSAARQLGYGLKLHADELHDGGGARLAAELHACSADHLLAASDDGLHAMAAAGVCAVLLPATSFYLQQPPARARFMIDDARLAVAIASDYNPGSAPSENAGLVHTLALLTLQMRPQEVYAAATRNAACAIGLADVAGVLAPGRPADVVVFAAKNPEYALTHFGIDHLRVVLSEGRVVRGTAG